MPPSLTTSTFGLASRSLPQPTQDGVEGELRLDRYRGVVIPMPFKYALADEGSYFTGQNPTPGTGTAHALTTAFSNTSALFSFFNKAQPGGKRIYLDHMRLIFTAVPATSLWEDFVVDLDATGRAPTAGNQTITGQNVNIDDGTQSIANLQAFSAAALTVPASTTSTRRIARFRVNTGQVINGDSILVQFGASDFTQPRSALAVVRATDVGQINGNAPPVVIGPQAYGTIYRWSAGEATTAPSFEFELGWWER